MDLAPGEVGVAGPPRPMAYSSSGTIVPGMYDGTLVWAGRDEVAQFLASLKGLVPDLRSLAASPAMRVGKTN